MVCSGRAKLESCPCQHVHGKAVVDVANDSRSTTACVLKIKNQSKVSLMLVIVMQCPHKAICRAPTPRLGHLMAHPVTSH